MAMVEKEKGDTNCKHNWTKREKQNVQILTRVCTQCGRLEHVSDNLSEQTIQIIKGE